MKIPIQSVAELGRALRAVRRSSGIRIDDMAATAGVSKQFASDVEHGKPTVQFDRVIKLLREMGISVSIDIPSDAQDELFRLQEKAAASGKLTASPTSKPVERD
ncbi:helix-turn-helix domain-containing protein [Polaromonas sp. AET17H-212]|uniref:helix-turn-helix domain-containing protein n=1 Tax=Polaromonas sp. AET17H-212 TaxID=1977061 RepID=UPI000BBC2BF9|nr:helix-turn-helix domain-containing protein [Polaromonas sp. AET17H-212]